MERRTFIKALAAVTALDCLATPAFAVQEEHWVERVRPLMGTYVSIAMHAVDTASAQELISECFQYLESCIALVSNWDQNSQTWRLNVDRRIALGSDTVVLKALLLRAEQVQRLSRGVFNPAILSLTHLWKEAKAAASIPSGQEITSALRRVAESAVTLDRGSVALHGESGLDFDGIGKGFMADLAGEFLKQRGVRCARVACSGDIRFVGRTEWVVDIQDPRSENMLGSVRIFGDCGVSTSGDYRNTWFVNGRRYHHLIDPRTGRPGQVCQQSTVVAPSCVLSDALSSACFFLNQTDSSRLLSLVHAAQGIFVSSSHRVFLAGKPSFSRALAEVSGPLGRGN